MSGDGRCDSPGSSAKFSTYTIMEQETGVIIQSETLDKREVNYKSTLMEHEGLKRCLEYVSSNTNISIKEITTDASSSIKLMLGIWHNIYINLDYMYISKGLSSNHLLFRYMAQG